MSKADYTTYHIETYYGELAYHVKGNTEGKHAFVYLHGHVDTPMDNGNYVIFDKNHNDSMQILLDFRWHGCSTRLQFYPPISQRAEDVDIFVQEITTKFPHLEKISLVGYSQGGSTLLYYLTNEFKSRAKIESAFLIAPRLDLKGYLKWFEKNVAEMEAKGEETFTKKYKSKGYISYKKEFIDEFLAIDFDEMVKNLDTPSKLIRGENDDLLSRDVAMDFVSKGEGYLEYYELKDCSHYPTREEWYQLHEYIYQVATN